MYCPRCRTWLADPTVDACPSCGAPIILPPPGPPPPPGPTEPPRPVDLRYVLGAIVAVLVVAVVLLVM